MLSAIISILIISIGYQSLTGKSLQKVEDLSKLGPLQQQINIMSYDDFIDSIKKKPLTFVAFYNYQDISKQDQKFINEIQLATEQLNKDGIEANFGFYNDIIDDRMEESYLLHFQTLPKQKVFYKGDSLTYSGGNRSTHIKAWIKRITRETRPTSLEIKDVQQLKGIMDDTDLLAVYYGDLFSTSYRIYLETMTQYKSALFCNTQSSQVLQALLNMTSQNPDKAEEISGDEIFLVNSERVTDIDGAKRLDSDFVTTEDIIKEFQELKKYQVAMLNIERFKVNVAKKKVFLFMIDRDFAKREMWFEKFCMKNQSKFSCYFADKDTNDFVPIWKDHFGMTLNHKPQVMYLDYRNRDISPQKYKLVYENMQSGEDFYNWYVGIQNNTVEEDIKSEPIPPISSNKHITELTGKTYQENVIDDIDNEVLVYIWAPTCQHCTDFDPIYDKVATRIKVKYPNIPLKLTKINAMANDVPGIDVLGYPLYALYLKGQQNRSPVFIGEFPDDPEGVIEQMKRFPVWQNAAIEDL